MMAIKLSDLEKNVFTTIILHNFIYIQVHKIKLSYRDDYINDFILPRKMIYCYINDIIAIQCDIQYTM